MAVGGMLARKEMGGLKKASIHALQPMAMPTTKASTLPSKIPSTNRVKELA